MQYTDSGGGWKSVALTTDLLISKSVKIFQNIVDCLISGLISLNIDFPPFHGTHLSVALTTCCQNARLQWMLCGLSSGMTRVSDFWRK